MSPLLQLASGILLASVIPAAKKPITATIDNWVDILRRSKISRNIGGRSIHFYVGSGTYEGTEEFATTICCGFDTHTDLFRSIEFMDIDTSKKMPKISPTVEISEWENLFDKSGLTSELVGMSDGGYLECPVYAYPGKKSGNIKPLRLQFIGNDMRVRRITLERKDQ